MPVTFSVAKHPANAVKLEKIEEGLTGEQILRRACRLEEISTEEVFQFSLSHESARDSSAKISHIVPQHNGFVDTVISAYNQHHALIIRPDDVWLAILSQFSFFVNANAELLRANFVAHEGKKHLAIEGAGTRHSVDFSKMSQQMVELIDKNVVDPALREWILPKFSTTTVNDITVGAILAMATLKEYFSYEFDLRCGIPRVTLEGEKSDWVNILGRLEKLKEYGIEAIAWYHLLRPVILRFVAAFDTPESRENVDFWQKVAHYEEGGSGPSYYSGWINAFNVFSSEGAWLGHPLNTSVVQTNAPKSSKTSARPSVRKTFSRKVVSISSAAPSDAPESLSVKRFWATYAKRGVLKDLVLDGTPFHRLDSRKVPAGFAEVDVKLNDCGQEFNCAMTAGMIGMKVSSSGDASFSSSGTDDTVRPVAGWWMYEKTS
ncbi:hypothetical protein C8R44DRAFT_788448 [Mycena epipterygia]|nr:hypothetical protein C8R44DRAFT_788448 [Mycena epipterygia]